MNDFAIRVAKNCPNCGERLFDRVSLAKGFVEIKCPKCKRRVCINLSTRLSRSRYGWMGYSDTSSRF